MDYRALGFLFLNFGMREGARHEFCVEFLVFVHGVTLIVDYADG